MVTAPVGHDWAALPCAEECPAGDLLTTGTCPRAMQPTPCGHTKVLAGFAEPASLYVPPEACDMRTSKALIAALSLPLDWLVLAMPMPVCLLTAPLTAPARVDRGPGNTVTRPLALATSLARCRGRAAAMDEGVLVRHLPPIDRWPPARSDEARRFRWR